MGPANGIDDGLLRLFVGIGHQVHRVLVFDLEAGPGIFQEDLSGNAGRLDRRSLDAFKLGV